MPLIRFSALVSDMKGKLNGSVFASNASGAYFRNNPAGGGRKSAKWAAVRSKFSQLSARWRSLSIAEQDAWNAARTLYPVLDKFGNPRTPSGFELFMRINGNLANFNGSFLSVPGAPATFPSLGAASITGPDLWQYTPQRALALGSQNTGNDLFSISNPDLFGDTILFRDRVFSGWFDFSKTNLLQLLASDELQLFIAGTTSGIGFRVWLTSWSGSEITLTFKAFQNGGSITWSHALSLDELLNPFHLICSLPTTGYNSAKFYVNGVDLALSPSVTGTPVDDTVTGLLTYGPDVFVSDYVMSVTDLRYFKHALSAEDAQHLSYGYVLGYETVMLQTFELQSSKVKNYGVEGASLNFDLSFLTSYYSRLAAFNALFVPLAYLETANPGAQFFYIQIFTSTPLSAGRKSLASQFLHLGNFATYFQQKFFLSPGLRSVVSNMPANGQLMFNARLLSTVNGQDSPNIVEGAKKGGRFKAGADLSSRVN